MDAKQYFVYLFRVKDTGEVIYVGSCKAIGNRLNEHRRSLREESRRAPIHQYMLDNGLDFGKNVEIVIVEYLENTTKEKALEVEAEYFYKYRQTIKNTRPAEDRTGEFSPRNKPVKCLNDDKIYISVRQAAEHYGISRYSLMQHLNNGSKLRNGLAFDYINEENVDKRIYVVECVEDQRKFTTLRGCAEHYNLPYSNFTREMKTEGKYSRSNKTFVRCND